MYSQRDLVADKSLIRFPITFDFVCTARDGMIDPTTWITWLFCFWNFSSGGSPESGLGTSHNSLGAGGPTVAVSEIETGEFDGEFYTEEPLQPLGTCKALYPFEGII